MKNLKVTSYYKQYFILNKKLSVNSILFLVQLMSMVKILLCQLMRKLICPDNYYAASKLINESSILNFNRCSKCDFKDAGIYGSPNDNISIIGRFTEAIKNNNEIQINGTGAQLLIIFILKIF